MPFKNKNLLLLHLLVFIWGWSPILGKLLNMEGVTAYQLVWFRMLITVISIVPYLVIAKKNIKLPGKDILQLVGIGVMIAFYWLSFYHAINISNVSVTLVAFATGTLFTSIIEPVFYKRKVIVYEIIFGMIIVAAIALIFKVETRYTAGIILGMSAALTSSFYNVFNGLLTRKIESSVIVIYELSGGFIVLSIFLFFAGEFNQQFFYITPKAWGWEFVLAIVTTAYPFIASVDLMKKINPYTVILALNLQVIYGIIFAYILWEKDEAMTPGFYLGTLVMLVTIFGNDLLKSYLRKRLVKLSK